MKKKLSVEEKLQNILNRPHLHGECPSKGMFGRDCKNCRTAEELKKEQASDRECQ